MELKPIHLQTNVLGARQSEPSFDSGRIQWCQLSLSTLPKCNRCLQAMARGQAIRAWLMALQVRELVAGHFAMSLTTPFLRQFWQLKL